MKPTARTYIPTLLMCFTCAPLWAGTEGSSSTFYGSGAGANGSGSSGDNTFVGASAGNATSTGAFNVFVGEFAGLANALGSHNTAVGTQAGYSATGSGNVFLGDSAGVNEIGSNKLYIDNCLSPSCALPFIYGEFDNHLLNINGVTNVAANNAPISQLHFSIANADSGGWLTSVLQNNFFVSSGARYDGTQPAGHNWVQRSIDGRAVSAGSGSVGYRIFTSKGHSVGDTFDITDSTRLFINYDGEFGINGAPVAGHEIHTSSGAYLTAGGVWTDASSRDLKEHIVSLTSEDATRTLAELNPVRYNYKVTPAEAHVGFIAEDVPELVARQDRKGVAPMDIVAVLTKVVQEKSRLVDAQKVRLDEQAEKLDRQERMLAELAASVARLEAERGGLKQE